MRSGSNDGSWYPNVDALIQLSLALLDLGECRDVSSCRTDDGYISQLIAETASSISTPSGSTTSGLLFVTLAINVQYKC